MCFSGYAYVVFVMSVNLNFKLHVLAILKLYSSTTNTCTDFTDNIARCVAKNNTLFCTVNKYAFQKATLHVRIIHMYNVRRCLIIYYDARVLLRKLTLLIALTSAPPLNKQSTTES